MSQASDLLRAAGIAQDRAEMQARIVRLERELAKANQQRDEARAQSRWLSKKLLKFVTTKWIAKEKLNDEGF
jgi:hypothetical protein